MTGYLKKNTMSRPDGHDGIDYMSMLNEKSACGAVPFTKPMSHRDLCAVNAQLFFTDCENRCDNRWRHWPVVGRDQACLDVCRAAQDRKLESCRTLPARAPHCPYNQRGSDGSRSAAAAAKANGTTTPKPKSNTTDFLLLAGALALGVGLVYALE